MPTLDIALCLQAIWSGSGPTSTFEAARISALEIPFKYNQGIVSRDMIILIYGGSKADRNSCPNLGNADRERPDACL